MGRILGYIRVYTHLSTTAVSPFLHCFTMSWWVGGSLRGFQCCTTYCCTAVVLLYCCCTGLWVGRSVLSCRVLLSCVHTGSWVCLFLFLPLYRPRAGIVKRAASDYKISIFGVDLASIINRYRDPDLPIFCGYNAYTYTQ